MVEAEHEGGMSSGGMLAAGQEMSADALAKQVQHNQFQQQALFNETPFRLI